GIADQFLDRGIIHGRPDSQKYNIDYRLFSKPYEFESNNLLLSGSLEGEVSYRDDELVDQIDNNELAREIEAAAQNKIRTTYWDIVFYGGRLCLYVQSGDDLLVTNNLGDEVARGPIARIISQLSGLTNEEDQDVSNFQLATNLLTRFFEQTFFRQEGLHLVEHVLLRPKVNNVWVKADVNDVKKIPEQDVFIPVKDLLSSQATAQSGQLFLPGDFSERISLNAEVTLIATNGAEQVSTITRVDYKPNEEETEATQEGNTILTVDPSIRGEFDRLGSLQLRIKRMVPIVNIRDSDENAEPVLDLADDDDLGPLPDDAAIRLTDARDEINYGEFRVTLIRPNEGSPTSQVILKEFKLQDRLLPIYIPNPENDIVEPGKGQECDDCKIENPYSFIAQVVVAGWPGRFDNIDFRDFFERTLQLESPAHVFLNICWVGYDQMEVFERRYKQWILANLKDVNSSRCERSESDCSQEELDNLEALSKAQNELVEIIYELRNVYPVKTLHDCDEGEGTEGAIILNQTALGEI
ncbi:MAG: hypothetical protein AAF551_13950, partial [Bacteroidota bacterium]